MRPPLSSVAEALAVLKSYRTPISLLIYLVLLVVLSAVVLSPFTTKLCLCLAMDYSLRYGYALVLGTSITAA